MIAIGIGDFRQAQLQEAAGQAGFNSASSWTPSGALQISACRWHSISRIKSGFHSLLPLSCLLSLYCTFLCALLFLFSAPRIHFRHIFRTIDLPLTQFDPALEAAQLTSCRAKIQFRASVHWPVSQISRLETGHSCASDLAWAPDRLPGTSRPVDVTDGLV